MQSGPVEPLPLDDPGRLNPGTRVFGEYEGRYFPGTVMEATQGGWNVEFDDGERATCAADALCIWSAPQGPISPGTQVLAQNAEDGAWYTGRVVSGPDGKGRIPEPSARVLREVGQWIGRHERAIHGAGPSPLGPLAWGECTVRADALFLHVRQWPRDGPRSRWFRSRPGPRSPRHSR